MVDHRQLAGLPQAIALPPRRLLAGLRWLVVAAASLLVLHEGVTPTTLNCAVILGMLLGQETFAFWLAGRELAAGWTWLLLGLDLAGVSAATIVSISDAGFFFLLYPLILVEIAWLSSAHRGPAKAYLLAAVISSSYITAQIVGVSLIQHAWGALDWVLLVLEVMMFFIVTGISLNVFVAWRAQVDQLSQLTLLDELSLLLADTRQLDDVLASLVELVPTALAVQACVIAIDEPGSGRRIWANLGADTSALIDEALLARPARDDPPDLAQPRITIAHDAYAMISMHPLEIDDRAVGLLSVARVTPQPFGPDDQRLFKSLARHAAQALRNARLYRLEAEAARASRTLEQFKSEMLTGVSHEFRLPLTSISLATETLIAQRTGRGGDETEERLLRNIQRSAHRLGGFVQDLLDLARLDGHQLELRSHPFNLVLLITAAATFVEPACEMKRQHLRVQLTLDECIIQGDEKRIEQVLSNLLTNAQQYTPEGGEIWLTLAPATPQLLDEPGHFAGDADQAIVVGIHDSGPGIPVEERGQIFERFSRGEAGRRRSSGVGLGLYIARSVVELHGGRLWIGDSHLGGSTFWCLLPLAPVDDEPLPIPALQSAAHVQEGE